MTIRPLLIIVLFISHAAFPSTPSMSSQHCGLVVVDTADEFTLVWGKAPFFAPDSATAAVEDLLLLHTQ